MMNISKSYRLAALVFTTMLLLVAVVPASADTLHKIVYPWNDTWTWYADDNNPCGVDIVFQVEGEVRAHYWEDENGVFKFGVESYGSMRGKISANGKTIGFRMQGPIIYQFEDNEWIVKLAGANWLYTAPGYGNVFGMSGLLIEHTIIDPATGEVIDHWVEKLVGNVNWDDYSEMCEYFNS